MYIARSKDELQKQIQILKSDGQSIGFVPTMGALHAGHLSLIELAHKHADKVVVSIFVNPTQFAPTEDFDSYPRDLDSDAAKLKEAGVAVIYFPSDEDIYPEGLQITVKAGAAAQGLEAEFRPAHFDGVTTVVHALLSQVQADVAIFGEKDFQQLQVITDMVRDQRLAVEIIGAPIARDESGLALSSRNAYLSEDEVEIARMLNQAIYKAAQDIRDGVHESVALKEAESMIITCGFDKVDYVHQWRGRVLAAAWLGKTRLIDNCAV